MGQSSSSAVTFLPFGSLTGVVPIDAVPLGRKLGEFSSVLAVGGQRPTDVQQQIHSLINPVSSAPRCPAMSSEPDIGV